MKNSKKGFTLVELIIVVAVIALLAAVLIPTFSSLISKANQAKDEALVSNLNKAIALSTEKFDTVHGVLGAVKDNAGFDVAKISASVSEHEILWDSVNYCFVYKTEKGITGIPDTQTIKDVKDYQYWRFVNNYDYEDIANSPYSVYWYGAELDSEKPVKVSVGFDAGEKKVAQVNYVHTATEEQKVTIRTNGGNLLVNAQNDTVFHYGDSTSVKVEAIATSSYHVYGNVEGTIVVESGHVQIEKSAKVGSMILATKSEGNNAEAVPTITATKGSQVGTIVVNDISSEVTVEEGATVATLAPGKGVTIDKSKVTGIKVSTKQVDTDKASVFAGGLGIKNNPYLIANAQQLMYLNDGTLKGSSINNAVYLKLIDNIDLKNETPLELEAQKLPFKCYLGNKSTNGTLYYFNIDGDGHDVYLADNISFIGDIRNSTLKNVNLHMGGEASVSAVAFFPKGAKMENVSIYSDTKLTYDRNAAIFVGTANTNNKGASLTLKNCKNYAKIECTVSENGYNGMFIGAISVLYNAGPFTLTVNGFENYGSIKAGKFAAIGNVYGDYGVSLKFNIRDVRNEGSITSFNAPLNQFVAVKNAKSKFSSISINGVEKTSEDNFFENYRIASANETMTLTENSDKTLIVTKSAETNVSYYVVSLNVYTNYKNGTATGTDIYTISEKITASSFVDGKFTTTLKNIGFANAQEGTTTAAVTSSNTEITHSTRSNNENVLTMTVNGELCYVVDIPYETVSGIKYASNSLITVTAYDENGSPISSVYLTK